MAEREGFSSAPYRKSHESNDLENNSFIFFLLSEVSIVSLLLSGASKKQTPNRSRQTRMLGVNRMMAPKSLGTLLICRPVQRALPLRYYFPKSNRRLGENQHELEMPVHIRHGNAHWPVGAS